MIHRAFAIAVFSTLPWQIHAQTFDASSVKPSAPDRGGATLVRGGPGSSDPALATFENIDLFTLAAMAYNVKRHELSAPAWMNSARFDVTARVPAGTTADQYRLMLQSLLKERFHLTFHREQRQMEIYDLAIAKNGPKLKQSEPDPSPLNDGLQPPPPRAGPPPGYRGPVHFKLTRQTMEQFASLLSGLIDAPVANATGLDGKYDIQLDALATLDTPAAENPTPILPDALRQELGLTLRPRKDSVDVLVMDDALKIPLEN